MVGVAVMAASMLVLWPLRPVGQAAQGDLDPSFAGTGQVVTDLTGQFAEVNGIAVRPDGTVLAAGTVGPAADPGSAADLVLLRHDPAGKPDPTFDGDGVLTLDLFGDLDEGHAVVVQPDGKIVVAGTTIGRTATRDLVLLRFGPDGTPDTTFGAGGRVVFDSGWDDEAYTLALDGSGRVVVGGFSQYTYAVWRFTTAGAPDTTFGQNGHVLATAGGQRVSGLLVDGQGRILATGPAYSSFVTFRLLDDGQPDYSFGQYGVAYYNIGGESFNEARAVALLADGRIVVAGRHQDQAAVLRYDADGQALDESFAGGYVLLDLGAEPSVATAVAGLDQGEVLVAGTADGDMSLARLTEQGQPAPQFGDGGVVRTDVAGRQDEARAMAMLPDGRPVLGGVAGTGLGCDLAVLRYQADGAPDGGFGAAGVAATDLTAPGDEPAALVLTDSGLVAAGSSGGAAGWDFSAVRYDQFGFPDPRFGFEGQVGVDFGGDDRAYAVASTPGRVYIAGESNGGFAVAALHSAAGEGAGEDADGVLVPSFGAGGRFTHTFEGAQGGARAVAVQPDGRIVLAGYDGSGELVLMRLNPDANLDETFGDGNGIVVTSLFGASALPRAVAVQPDGRIVVAGDIGPSDSLLQFDGDRDLVVLRLMPDGAVDEEFGSGGAAYVDFENGNDEARALALQPDGKIVVAAVAYQGYEGGLQTDSLPGAGGDLAVARLLPNGDRDFGDESGYPGFGGNGEVVLNLGGREAATALAIVEDTIVVAGQTSGPQDPTGDGPTDVALLRLLDDGEVDPDFGTQEGVTVTDLAGGNDLARGLAVLPSGELVVAGLARRQARTDYALVKYSADGVQDRFFGGTGVVRTNVVGDVDVARAVAVQPDGKVLVAGEAHAGAAGDFALVRYQPDGSLDAGFGVGGRLTTDVSGGSDGAHAVLVQPDGAIVVGGAAGRGFDADFAVVRYTPRGELDESFGDGGVVLADFGETEDVLRALVLQPDGKLLAAGSAVRGGGGSQLPLADFALLRLHPDGAVDQEFGEGGEVTTDFDGGFDEAHALALQPDGHIVVAGSAAPYFDQHVGLARYNASGALDATFDEDGRVSAEVPGQGTAVGVAVQPDGGLLAAIQFATSEGGRSVAVQRYLADGKPDLEFGAGQPLLPDSDGRTSALLLQPDGGIVVGADALGGDELRDAVVLRLRPDGVGDPRFGEGGVAFSGPTGVAERAGGMALQPNGQILLVGRFGTGEDGDFTALRFVGGETGPIGPPADLAVQLVASVDANAPRVGLPLRFVITVSNGGPSPATAVTVSGELPASLTLLSTTSGQGQPCRLDAAVLICPLGDIAVGASVGLTITVQPTEPGPLTHTVRVASDQFDPDLANDSATVSLTVAPRSEIRINPGVVALGRVAMIIGTGFTPGAAVSLGYRNEPDLRSVVPKADGTFAAPLVVFTETTPGPRAVEARAGAQVLASTNLLVVSDTLAPPNFVGRG